MSYNLTFLPIMYTSFDTMVPCRRVLGVGKKKERPECSWLNKARSFSATNSVMSGEQESANRLGLKNPDWKPQIFHVSKVNEKDPSNFKKRKEKKLHAPAHLLHPNTQQ